MKQLFSKISLLSVISAVVICVMALATIGAFLVNYWINVPLALNDDRIITVRKGDTLSKIAYELEASSVIHSARLLIVYAQLSDKTRLEIGDYLLTKKSSRQQLLNLLQSGDVIRYDITLVEGKTFNDFLKKIRNEPKFTHVLMGNSHAELIEELSVDIGHLEGWFFPDTYQFSSGVTDKELLLQSHQRMQDVLQEEWNNRAENLPYKNAYEALIMASIIEKETGVAYERPEIAGVFVRRLQKGMRLQTDPTIIYGLGDEYTGNIRRKHLKQPTPYNTYLINGLPPTPIAMPGRAAIHAALHPKSGSSLYFVAKGDGSHHFSATLAEHNSAVNKYQIRKRRTNYQSSPSK